MLNHHANFRFVLKPIRYLCNRTAELHRLGRRCLQVLLLKCFELFLFQLLRQIFAVEDFSQGWRWLQTQTDSSPLQLCLKRILFGFGQRRHQRNLVAPLHSQVESWGSLSSRVRIHHLQLLNYTLIIPLKTRIDKVPLMLELKLLGCK